MTADIVIRPAVAPEKGRIADIIFKEPPRESVWMLGNKRKATALGKAMVAMDGEMNWRNTTVAEMGGQVVGVMQRGLGPEGGVNVGPMLIWHTLRIVGPFGVPGLLRRMKARERLNFTRPEGSYHISELHVDSSLRGKGIGGKLLDHAEEEARVESVARMSLVTAIDNPARHLYERHGFLVIETKRDAEYEAATGSEGRVLMMKRV